MQIFTCFLKTETRLAILHFLIEIVCTLEQESKGMEYVESVAKRFGLFDRLWLASNMDDNTAKDILKTEKSDNICLCRAIMGHLLTVNDRFVGFGKYSSCRNKILEISDYFKHMSAEYNDPLDDRISSAWVFKIYLVNN